MNTTSTSQIETHTIVKTFENGHCASCQQDASQIAEVIFQSERRVNDTLFICSSCISKIDELFSMKDKELNNGVIGDAESEPYPE
jgi:hypothetical protein